MACQSCKQVSAVCLSGVCVAFQRWGMALTRCPSCCTAVAAVLFPSLFSDSFRLYEFVRRAEGEVDPVPSFLSFLPRVEG